MDDDPLRARFIEQAFVAQEEERRRIARELHDEVGQTLASLLVRMKALEAHSDADPGSRAIAAELRAMAMQALDGIGRIARGLRPAALDELGLAAALEHLAGEFQRTHGVVTDAQIMGLSASRRLADAVEIALYRIVQEALTNVAKHAAASRVSVVVERKEDGLDLIVEDDGRGMSGPEDAGKLAQRRDFASGFGLVGIRERVALLGGSLTVESSPGGGTTLYVRIPVTNVPPMRFWLRCRGAHLPLNRGRYVIGRGVGCDVVLDHGLVSRRHALLTVDDTSVVLEDLGSANGVWLNGRRIGSSERLANGDRISLGDEELVLRAGASADPLGDTQAGTKRTARPEPEPDGDEPRGATAHGDGLDLAHRAAERLLARQRPKEAERLLTPQLDSLLEMARARGTLEPDLLDKATSIAVWLMSATGKTSWAHYVVSLHQAVGRRIPYAVATALPTDRVRPERTK